MIQIKAPDGSTVQFPDGTDDAIITKVMAENFPPQKPKGGGGSLADIVASAMTFGLTNDMAGLSQAAGPAARYLGSAVGIPGVEYKPGEVTDAYSQGRNRSVRANNEYRDTNPVKAFAGDMVGGIANPATRLGMPAQGASMLQKALLGGATGTGMGAAYGFGNAEGDLGDRGIGAATGGLIGGVVGTAAAPVAEGVGKGVRYLADQSIGRFSQAGQGTVSGRKVIEALQRDGLTPDQAMTRIQRLGPEASLMDVGPNSQALAASISRSPGKGKTALDEFVTTRQEGTRNPVTGELQGGQYGRVSAALDDVTPDRLKATVDGIVKARSTAAAPIYEEAFTQPPGVQSPWLDDLLKDPDAMKGFSRGLKVQMKEHLAEQQRLPPNQRTAFDPGAYGVTAFNEAGDPIIGKTPSLRTFDSVKRGLDAMIAENTDAVTGKVNEMGRALTLQKQALVSELKGLTGGDQGPYARALDAWSGPSRIMGAARDGSMFLGGGPKNGVDDLRARVAKMSPDEAEALRVGAVQALRDKIGGKVTRADLTKALMDIPDLESRVRIAFGDQQTFQRYINMLQGERTMFDTYAGIKGNSRTAERLAADADLNKDPGGLAASLAGVANNPTSIPGWLRVGANAIGDAKTRMGTPEPVRDRVADLLMSRNIQDLGPGMKAAQMSEERRRMLARALLGSGASWGGYSAP